MEEEVKEEVEDLSSTKRTILETLRQLRKEGVVGDGGEECTPEEVVYYYERE